MIRDLLESRLESKIPGLIELIPMITVCSIIIHVNDGARRNAKLFMKISIRDSGILEKKGKILGSQIHKAISKILNRVRTSKLVVYQQILPNFQRLLF